MYIFRLSFIISKKRLEFIGVSELKRQHDSSLYERLSLSKNKDEVMLLSQNKKRFE